MNTAFEVGGFPYTNGMRNMGSTFIFLVVNMGLLVGVIVMPIFSCKRVKLWVR